jgi:outer membrane protein
MHRLAAILLCGLMTPGVVAAQTTGALKIGWVNVARLIQESPQARAIQKALEEEFSPRQRELVAKQNELKERQAKLQKDLEVMGAEERRNAESAFRNDERDLGRRQNEFLEDFNVRRNEEIGKLQRELLKEVQAFAKERGYDLIVGEGVLYAGQGIEVTQQIVEALEATSRNKVPGKN